MHPAPENLLMLSLQVCVPVCALHGAAAGTGQAPVCVLILSGVGRPGPETQEVSTPFSPMPVRSTFMNDFLPGPFKTYPKLHRN